MVGEATPAYVVPVSRGAGRKAVARIALVLVVSLAIVFLLHPLWLGPLLGRYLSSTSGREVHFDSVRVDLSPALAPVVHMRGVRIANAPWSETKAPFAAFGEVVFVFDWGRFEGRRVVSHLLLRDGVVHLELRADGLRNWRLVDPEDRSPGHFWFYSLEGHQATLAFINHGNGLHFEAAAKDLPASAGALPTRIDFDGEFRHVAFKGSVDTEPTLTFMQTGRRFGLRGHAAIDGVTLEADGRAADIMRGTQIDAHASLAGRSLAALEPLVGDRYAEPRAFRVDGHVRSGAGRYALSDAQARVGATDLAGDAEWSRAGGHPVLRAHVASASADAADLLWLTGRSPAHAAAEARLPPTAAPASARDVFAATRNLDADVAFEAAHFRIAASRFVQSLKLKAGLAAGQGGGIDVDLGWAGGHTAGKLDLDLREPLARLGATLDTSGIRVETLLGAQEEKKRITGLLRSRVTLRASGNTLDALRESVSGSAYASLVGGRISSLLDAEIGLEGGKVMRTLISGVEFLPLSCAEATLDLAAGKARVRSLVLESPNTRIAGSGSVDLRDEAIDLILTPTPKRPGMFELQRSIHLFGRLPKPQRALIPRVEPPATGTCPRG